MNRIHQPRLEEIMPYLERSRDIAIWYEVYGTGPPLLLSHGYSSTSEMWQGQIAALSAQHQLIIWDMRGHGRSSYPEDPSAYSEEHTVADMKALLDVIGVKGQAIIGGLSLGGYMSLAFYRTFPDLVSKLLIIDTGPGFKSDKARDKWNETAHNTANTFQEKGLKALQSQSPERAQASHRDAEGLALAAKGMLTQRNDAVMQLLPKVKVPSLIIVGADDKPFLAAADYMKARIPNAEKVVIPHAGHASNIDQPKIFNDAVLRFLGGSRNSARL